MNKFEKFNKIEWDELSSDELKNILYDMQEILNETEKDKQAKNLKYKVGDVLIDSYAGFLNIYHIYGLESHFSGMRYLCDAIYIRNTGDILFNHGITRLFEDKEYLLGKEETWFNAVRIYDEYTDERNRIAADYNNKIVNVILDDQNIKIENNV